MNRTPFDLHTGPLQLRDGRRVWFRPIRPSDAAPLRRFHRRLSPETQRMRFFTPLRELSQPMADRFSNVDFEDRAAVVAVYPGEEELRGVARYEITAPGEAEVAFVLEDDLQGHGIGKEMLFLLARHALQFGVTKFTANVLCENAPMLRMFRNSGFPTSFRVVDGAYYVEMDIAPAATPPAPCTWHHELMPIGA